MHPAMVRKLVPDPLWVLYVGLVLEVFSDDALITAGELSVAMSTPINGERRRCFSFLISGKNI